MLHLALEFRGVPELQYYFSRKYAPHGLPRSLPKLIDKKARCEVVFGGHALVFPQVFVDTVLTTVFRITVFNTVLHTKSAHSIFAL